MSEFSYRLTLRTKYGDEIQSLYDDYYEAVKAAMDEILEYKDICIPANTTIEDMIGEQVIASQKYLNIPGKDKVLATILSRLDKDKADDDLVSALETLHCIESWNKIAGERSRISYRIVKSVFIVYIIVEGYHYSFCGVY